MDVEKVLKTKMGMCVFPVGDCKQICGEPTLLDANSNYTPFCAKHTREIESRFKHNMQKKNKKSNSSRVVGRKFV